MMILLAIFVGANSVMTRIFNAHYAQKGGLGMSTMLNYLTGLIVSGIVLWISGEQGPAGTSSQTLPLLWVCTGGVTGVIMILLCNYLTPRMPSFLLTLLLFTSQLLAAMVIDGLLGQPASIGKWIGCFLVLAGMLHYRLMNQKSTGPKETSEA